MGSIGVDNCVRYIADCRSLPGKSYAKYLMAKHKHEMQLENYTMDCLREIVMQDERKTLPRYFDYINKKNETKSKLDERTGEQIVDDIIKML